jgi:hypothetical protein
MFNKSGWVLRGTAQNGGGSEGNPKQASGKYQEKRSLRKKQSSRVH